MVEQNVIDNEKILLKTKRSERVIKYSAEHVFTLRGTEEKKRQEKLQSCVFSFLSRQCFERLLTNC